MSSRIRRSVHFVPGPNEKMFGKAVASDADALVLDLEDAVPPGRKEDARREIAEWLRSAEFRGKERIVRFNPLDTPWGEADLAQLMVDPPDSLMMSKVSTLEEIRRVDRLLEARERELGHEEGRVKLVLIATETPASVINLATFPECPRVDALNWGAEDLSAALGSSRNRDLSGDLLPVFRHCQTQTLLAARAGGVQALDAVFVDIRDLARLRRETEEAAWMGFDGKLTIHPDQIPIVNELFTPSEEALTEARELIAAFEAAEAEGRMAFAFRGQMVDAPHLSRARNIVERAAKAGLVAD